MASCLAVLLLATSFWLALSILHRARSVEEFDDLVRQSQLALETLFSTLKDAETGQRGYLLTGDPEYLEPYLTARNRLDAEFARTAQAPPMTPAELRRIEHMRELAAASLEEIGRTIALRQSGQTAAALDIVRTNEGRKIMAALRIEVGIMRTDMDLQLHTLAADAGLFWSWIAVVGPALLASLLLAGVALLQHRVRLSVAASLASLERFTEAFGLTQGMLRTRDGGITFWTDGMERLYGYSRAEALGRRRHELLGSQFPYPLVLIEADLKRDGYWQGELRHHRRDGTELIVVSHWALHRGVNGGPDVIIEVDNDITALKTLETELRDNKFKLRLAIDASNLGIWLWEVAKGDGFFWDARCKSLFGFADDRNVDYAAWAGRLDPADRAQAEALMARAVDPAESGR